MHIVGCFLRHNDRFVILLRHKHKPNGGTWGLPAGKVKAGETEPQAMVRELHEETGYQASPDQLEHLGTYMFGKGSDGYRFSAFVVSLPSAHQLVREHAAHADHRWVTAEECYAMPDLIVDFRELLRNLGYVAR